MSSVASSSDSEESISTLVCWRSAALKLLSVVLDALDVLFSGGDGSRGLVKSALCGVVGMGSVRSQSDALLPRRPCDWTADTLRFPVVVEAGQLAEGGVFGRPRIAAIAAVGPRPRLFGGVGVQALPGASSLNLSRGWRVGRQGGGRLRRVIGSQKDIVNLVLVR
ncbi:hypothetical protein TPAR_05541 [Tolypocladium paradoxum]|uniref:Uncharacterized protein n=1 Tax=Tolypocladium paradoxum TaxID=94208 RepID=A0A2S4KVQ9_9HYPO|nr:hypothetical protein TPAR_05541 [Tolypocladium paradoxum]